MSVLRIVFWLTVAAVLLPQQSPIAGLGATASASSHADQMAENCAADAASCGSSAALLEDFRTQAVTGLLQVKADLAALRRETVAPAHRVAYRQSIHPIKDEAVRFGVKDMASLIMISMQKN